MINLFLQEKRQKDKHLNGGRPLERWRLNQWIQQTVDGVHQLIYATLRTLYNFHIHLLMPPVVLQLSHFPRIVQSDIS
jgi:hypothetical protein